MKIDRMLAIIVMLLNRDRVSAKELSEKFEVSVRTIYRDIDAINLAGIPIISYSGNNGGFGIMENYKIDHQLLTLKDMFTMLTALKGINTTLENIELETAIEKVSSLIPKEKTEDLKIHFEQIVLDIMPWGYRQKHKNQVKEIHEAVIHNKLIKFLYTNIKGVKTERVVEPMTLLFKGYVWYLFAFCHERNDYRIFRLSRIRSLVVLEKVFNRREKTYHEFMHNSEKNIKDIDLVLKFTPEMRIKVEEIFDEEQIDLQENGFLIVKASWPEDDWIYATILSFGENVEVIKPVYVKEKIKEKAKNILKVYNK